MLVTDLLVFTLGAFCLAAIYHTLLFIHRRDVILRHYCIYLWVLFFYLIYRLKPNPEAGTYYWERLHVNIAVDGTLLMLTYLAYAKFWGVALSLGKDDRPIIWRFYKSAAPVIVAYIIWENIVVNIKADIMYGICYIAVRVYLSVFGLLALGYALRKRRNAYFYYLSGGTAIIIISGLLSTFIQFLPGSKFLGISPFGWMLSGYFLDVVFFSAAIGYRLRIEAVERVAALNKVLEQQIIIQKNAAAQMQATYEAREQERTRISIDLHDDVGATLSSMYLYGSLATDHWNDKPQQSRTMVEKITEQSKQLMSRMGDIVWSMQPAADDKNTIESRLKNHAAELLAAKEIVCHFMIDDSTNTFVTNPLARKNIVLIAKEAMNNIAKYSSASVAGIVIKLTDEKLILEITDNGCGFDNTIPSNGNGISNINSRCVQLSGACQVQSALGRGTVISCTFPLAAIKMTG